MRWSGRFCGPRIAILPAPSGAEGSEQRELKPRAPLAPAEGANPIFVGRRFTPATMKALAHFATACADLPAQSPLYVVDVRCCRRGSQATGRELPVRTTNRDPGGRCVRPDRIDGPRIQRDSGTPVTNHRFSNRNCRSEKHRHPERPSGVEGTLLRPGREARIQPRGEEKANRNSH